MKEHQDAFGHALYDYFEGKKERVRELGWETPCNVYFSEYKDWFDREKKAITYAKGKVLDIGCAAGRHSLYLQERGHEVLAIDNSPLAIKVSQLRGVKNARVLSLTQVDYNLGLFDTIIMFGNNFGLVANPKRGKWIFRRFKRMTTPDCRVLAGSGCIRNHPDLDIQKQIAKNISEGKLPGEFHWEKRYGDYVLPIDWLYASKDDMQYVLDGTGWKVSEFIDDETDAFVGVLEKCR